MDVLVNIDVDDLAKGIAFYQAALGLSIGRRFSGLAVELGGASAPIYLLEKPEGSRASHACVETRRYDRHWTPVHLDVAVTDIEAAVKRALDAGATQEGNIETHLWGRIAHLADPFGHGLCLIEFLNRGYDEIADPP